MFVAQGRSVVVSWPPSRPVEPDDRPLRRPAPWRAPSEKATFVVMAANVNPRVQHLVEEAAELSPGDLAALIEAIQSLSRREKGLPERHEIIAERVARVQSGGAGTLSVDEVERSLRGELDF
jgi:hypothetical protein